MTEVGTKGVEEFKDLLTFAASLGEGIYETGKDGKLSIGDVRHFFPAAKDLIPAIQGILEVPGEIADLTEIELEQMKQHFKAQFDIPDDMVEEFVEKMMAFGMSALEVVLFIKRWRER